MNVNNTEETQDTVSKGDFTLVADAMEHQQAGSDHLTVRQMIPAYDDFIKHSYNISTFSWTNTTLAYAQLTQDLAYSILTGAPTALLNKYANFRFMDADIEVKVVVQGFPMAYGKMVLFFDPLPYNMSNLGASNAPGTNQIMAAPQKQRCMIVPNIVIDPSKDMIYTITLKNPSTFGVYSANLKKDTGSYNMGFIIINPLANGNGATPPTINIQIFASFINPKFSTLTYTSGSALDLKEMKPSAIASAFSEGFRAVEKVPVIGPFASIASTFSATASNFLNWFGFAKPYNLNQNPMTVAKTMQEVTVMDGTFNGHTLAMRQENSVTINANSIPMCSYEDQVIENIASIPAYITQVSVASTDTVGTIELKLPLSYNLAYATDSPAYTGGFEWPPYAAIARSFNYARSDFVVRLEFISSIFHRSSFCVAYFPNYDDFASPPTMINAISTVKTWQFQISGSSVHELIIPWSQVEPFVRCNGAASLTSSLGFCNGFFVIYLLNPVVSNSTNPVYINVYVGAKNVKYGYPNAGALNSVQYVMTSGNGLIAVPVSSNEKIADDVHFYRHFFGEDSPHTTKEMASRASVAMICYEPTSAARATNSMQWTMPASVIVNNNFLNSLGSTPAINFNGNVLGYLAGAYVGWKGSINYSCYPDNFSGTNGGGDVTNAKFTLLNFGTAGWSAVSDGLISYITPSGYGFSTMYSKLQNFLQAKVPYYMNGYYTPSFPISVSTLNARSIVLKVTTLSTSTPAIPTEISIFQSAGDDFNFVFFRGFPVMVG